MRQKLLAIALLFTFCGCSFATRSDVIQNNMKIGFKSSKTPGSLAVCVDRNADDYFSNTLQSKITSVPGEPIEILVRNGDTVYAVIQIQEIDGGSNAAIYLGGAALFSPDRSAKLLTKGCE